MLTSVCPLNSSSQAEGDGFEEGKYVGAKHLKFGAKNVSA